MSTFVFSDRSYPVDAEGFLSDPDLWDENFAEGMARSLDLPGELTRRHWEVIRSIREAFDKTGKCPLVYQTCRSNDLTIRELEELFPTGHLRGACKIAGLTYREGYVSFAPSWIRQSPPVAEDRGIVHDEDKVYRVNVRGFLIEPDDWDESYAICKAFEMKVGETLTDRHWQILRFLRERYRETGAIPTIYDTCEANCLDIEELEHLFPDGYHRGAVKIAGLRLR